MIIFLTFFFYFYLYFYLHFFLFYKAATFNGLSEKVKINDNSIVFSLISANASPTSRYTENFNFFDVNSNYKNKNDNNDNKNNNNEKFIINKIKIFKKNDNKNVKENEKLDEINQNLTKMCEIVKIAVTDFNRLETENI